MVDMSSVVGWFVWKYPTTFLVGVWLKIGIDLVFGREQMPPKQDHLKNPEKIQAVKKDGKFVLEDENGFIYDQGIIFKNKKEAAAAAEDWNEYYRRPLGQ